MTNGSGETVQPPDKTRDELFAEHFSRQVGAAGFHVEYGSDNQGDVTTHYALVMDQAEHDRLLEEQNRQAAINHAHFYRYTSGPSRPVFEPREDLYWDTTVSQPTFAGGQPSREEALMASARPILFQL